MLCNGVIDRNDWTEIANLILKNKITQKILPIFGNQFYRAILEENCIRYIATGIYSKERKEPLIVIQRM